MKNEKQPEKRRPLRTTGRGSSRKAAEVSFKDTAPRKVAAKARKPATPTPQVDWTKVSTYPVATVRSCVGWLMGLTSEMLREQRIDAFPPHGPQAELYNAILSTIARNVAAGHPLLKPFIGKATFNREKIQRIGLSLDYLVALVNSEFSPFRGLGVAEGFKALKPPTVFNEQSGAELVAKLAGAGHEPVTEEMDRGQMGIEFSRPEPEPVRKEHLQHVTLGLLLLELERLHRAGRPIAVFFKKNGELNASEIAEALVNDMAQRWKTERATAMPNGYKKETVAKRLGDARKAAAKLQT